MNPALTRRSSAVLIGTLAVIALVAPAAATLGGSPISAVVVADHVDPARCDAISTDAVGNIVVNGTPLTPEQTSDPFLSAVLRLAADAAGHENATGCLDVESSGQTIVVDGHLGLCGEVTFQRDPAPETPVPEASLPPVLGQPHARVDGVAIGDEILAVDSYAALEAAAAAGAETCFVATVVQNGAWEQTTSTVCATARLEEDRSLTLSIGGDAYRLAPSEIVDPDGVLAIGTDVEAALEIITLKDDVIHLISMTVSVADPEGCSPDATPPPPPAIPAAEEDVSPPPAADDTEETGTGPEPALLVLVVVLLVAGGALSVWLFRKA